MVSLRTGLGLEAYAPSTRLGSLRLERVVIVLWLCFSNVGRFRRDVDRLIAVALVHDSSSRIA